MLMMTDCNSGSARYHEMLSALRRIVKARDGKEDKPTKTLVKICEVLGQGLKGLY